MSLAIFSHEDCLEHRTGLGHPESPERLKEVWKTLRENFGSQEVMWRVPELAPIEALEAVHEPLYLQKTETRCLEASSPLDAADTVVSEDSFHAARLASGAAVAAIDSVFSGEVTRALVAMRPPGHHATARRAMGFCLLNHAAVAAQWAVAKYGVNRLCILDWDVHHGNGTQDIFYVRKDVLYISIHQSPAFPGSGGADECGTGPGEGYTLNLPMPPESTIEDYRRAWDYHITTRVEAFKPQLILVSAGFDAHADDPLANMRLRSRDFRELTERVNDLADRFTSNRIVSLLEGGYNLPALGASMLAHAQGLLGLPREEEAS